MSEKRNNKSHDYGRAISEFERFSVVNLKHGLNDNGQ